MERSMRTFVSWSFHGSKPLHIFQRNPYHNVFTWGHPNPNFPCLEHLVTIRNHEYVLRLCAAIHTCMKAIKRMLKRSLNCMTFVECGRGGHIVIYLYQNPFMQKYFCSISSWKISNLLCIYRATLLGH